MAARETEVAADVEHDVEQEVVLKARMGWFEVRPAEVGTGGRSSAAVVAVVAEAAAWAGESYCAQLA